jgi:formamidase
VRGQQTVQISESKYRARLAERAVRIDRGKPLRDEVHTGHNRWHPDIPPLLHVAAGEIVELETRDALDGQLLPGASTLDIGCVDASRIHPLTGPVFVEGAEPGDLLEVDILDVVPHGCGFTSFSGRYGILKNRCRDRLLVWWHFDNGFAVSSDLPGVRIPGAPFMGVMGVAPSHQMMAQAITYERGLMALSDAPSPTQLESAVPLLAAGGLRTIPPRDNGGNIDITELTAGAVIRLPVHVRGGLFSAGDAHYAQGDNECCSGIEMGATLRCSFRVLKDEARKRGIRDVQLYRSSERAAIRPSARGPFFATTGQSFSRDEKLTHDDLTKAAENALMNMIAHLQQEYGFSESESAIVCSVAVDLRINQASNNPNYLVSAFLPLEVVEGRRRMRSASEGVG